ncbi:hypothetical protein HDU97_002188 [Phlyctochytrium planicorne]|nr:hypothetical protein HDU97_002188 [Phlyctochytrium planicorne]
MVCFNTFTVAVATIASTMSTLAMPIVHTLQSPSLHDDAALNTTKITKRANTYESTIMLMHCTYNSPNSFTFSTAGLYPTVAKSQSGSLPSAQNAWYSYRGLTSFDDFRVDVSDGRVFYTAFNGDSLNKQPENAIGSAFVQFSRSSTAAAVYNCKRDNGRVVFDVAAGNDRVNCRAAHYCNFSGQLVA